MRVVLIAPALNEQGKIGEVVRRVRALADPPDMVVVDDGSTDRTATEASERGARVLSHPARRGVGAAIRTGFEWALAQGYDVVAALSGDNQHAPEDLPRLLEAVRAGADLVQGSRFLPGGRAIGIRRVHAASIQAFGLLFATVCRYRYSDPTNGFRAIRAERLREWMRDLRQPWLDRYELEPYTLWRAARSGARIAQVPITVVHPPRRSDHTKMVPVLDWWRLASPAVYLGLGLRT